MHCTATVISIRAVIFDRMAHHRLFDAARWSVGIYCIGVEKSRHTLSSLAAMTMQNIQLEWTTTDDFCCFCINFLSQKPMHNLSAFDFFDLNRRNSINKFEGISFLLWKFVVHHSNIQLHCFVFVSISFKCVYSPPSQSETVIIFQSWYITVIFHFPSFFRSLNTVLALDIYYYMHRDPNDWTTHQR